MTTIKTGEFVKRQTADSPFGHFSGSWEQLEKLVDANREKAVGGDMDGVFLTPVPAEGFFSAIAKVTPESKLISVFKPRRPGEDFFVTTTMEGHKVPAKSVVIVTYSKELLGAEATTGADYEIVSINASPTDQEIPMDPITIVRNYLGRPGGTKREYTEEIAKTMTREQWLEKMFDGLVASVFFHGQHLMVNGAK